MLFSDSVACPIEHDGICAAGFGVTTDTLQLSATGPENDFAACRLKGKLIGSPAIVLKLAVEA